MGCGLTWPDLDLPHRLPLRFGTAVNTVNAATERLGHFPGTPESLTSVLSEG